jgi:2-amino-4-hydroxy-6-hydroxymethyldihydropteridine diphosphokinase
MTGKMLAISLGSNLGDSMIILKDSLQALDRIPGITLKSVSNWYQTVAIGPPQPHYINGCAILEVRQNPQELLILLQAIEIQFGRTRSERWGARTLDLDIILYADLILNTPELQIPHPRMGDRAFVLIPLAEIAPNAIDPITQKTIAQLAKTIDSTGIKLLA